MGLYDIPAEDNPESLDFPLLGYKSLCAVQLEHQQGSDDWELISPLYPLPLTREYYDVVYWENGRLEGKCYDESPATGGHQPPDLLCSCGIHASFDCSEARTYMDRLWSFPQWAGEGLVERASDPVTGIVDSQPTVLGQRVEFLDVIPAWNMIRAACVEVVARAEGRTFLCAFRDDRLRGWRAAAASIEAFILPLLPKYIKRGTKLNAQYVYQPHLKAAEMLYQETRLFVEFFGQKFGVPVLTRRQASALVGKSRRRLRRDGYEIVRG